MPTNDTGTEAGHSASTVTHWLVLAVKTVATSVLRVIGWVVVKIVQGLRWLIRCFCGWFKNLNATGKILFICNIILLLMVIALWLDLDLWSLFYGQE